MTDAIQELRAQMAEWNALGPMTSAQQADLARQLAELTNDELMELLLRRAELRRRDGE